MFHHESWKPVYFGDPKVTRHKKHRRRGSWHSCECWLCWVIIIVIIIYILWLRCVNVCVSYQAPESEGTFYHADTSTATRSSAETRTRKQRRHYLSREIRSKFPDFPVMENRRDKLKQREKPQQQKRTALNVAEQPTPSSSIDVVDNVCRTDGAAEEKMDVWQ